MPKQLEVKISVTDMEIFHDLLDILADAHKRLSDEDKAEIFEKIDNLLGNEFHLTNFK